MTQKISPIIICIENQKKKENYTFNERHKKEEVQGYKN